VDRVSSASRSRDEGPASGAGPFAKGVQCEISIVIGLPMTTAAYNETNPFAIRVAEKGKGVAYVLSHQPKSFDWRGRHAKPHPWRQAPPAAFAAACQQLNQIVSLCS
jgi:mRNA interferase MazF